MRDETTMIARPRILGLDLARFVAIAGMVITHAYTDLYSIPRESAYPDGVVPLPSDPSWANALTLVFGGRSATLFYILAGISLTLLVRGDVRRAAPVLLKRALFLVLVVVGLLLVGWSDSILLVYAVWFVVAIGLLRLPTSWIAALAVVSLVTVATTQPLIDWAEGLDPGSPVTVALLLVGSVVVFPLGTPLLTFFLSGVLIGRVGPSTRRGAWLLAGGGFVAFAVAVTVLAARGYSPSGWTLAESRTLGDAYVQLVAVLGIDVAVVGACLLLCRDGAPRVVRPLVTSGSMALTAFVGHAVLFAVLFNRYSLTYTEATLVSLGYLVVIVVALNLWARTGLRGPLEEVMRRFSRRWRGPGSVSRARRRVASRSRS